VFCAGDVLRLLAHGAVSGATLACGLDFHRTDGAGESDFYDKWVQTDLDGRHALPPAVGSGAHERAPHKRPGESRQAAAHQAIGVNTLARGLGLAVNGFVLIF
jgi:hypothetical protein